MVIGGINSLIRNLCEIQTNLSFMAAKNQYKQVKDVGLISAITEQQIKDEHSWLTYLTYCKNML